MNKPVFRSQRGTVSPVKQLLGVSVVSTGSYVPDLVVRNEDLEQTHGFDPQWIVQRTGIRERRYAPPEVATSDMAIAAAGACINNSGVPTSEIDLVIVATYTPDMPVPSTASIVQDHFKLQAPAMDLQAGCSGFMYALVTAAQFIAAGTCRNALVVGADCNSRYADPSDQRTFPLFGDGAGAVLLAPGLPDQGLTAYTLGSDGSGANMLNIPLGGSRFRRESVEHPDEHRYIQMDGRGVFKWAVRVLNQTIHDVVEAAALPMEQIDLAVLHQANLRILLHAADCQGIHPEKLFINLDRYGNTSAASIPMALDEAIRGGRIRHGDNVLLSGFGAGLSWGTAVFHW